MASCNLYRVKANDPFYGFLYEVNNAPLSNEAFCCSVFIRDQESTWTPKVYLLPENA